MPQLGSSGGEYAVEFGDAAYLVNAVGRRHLDCQGVAAVEVDCLPAQDR
jgi:hypothetical protein